jgi:hypothetical protein
MKVVGYFKMELFYQWPIFITALVLLLSFGIVFLFLYHFYLQLQLPGEPRIQPSWIPYLGHAFAFGADPVGFLCKLASLGEEIVGVVLGGERIFFVMNPFSAPIIFKSNSDYSQEDFHNTVLRNFFGVSNKSLRNNVIDGNLMRKWYVQYLLG